MRDVHIRHEVEPYVGFVPSLLLCAVGTALAILFADQPSARAGARELARRPGLARDALRRLPPPDDAAQGDHAGRRLPAPRERRLRLRPRSCIEAMPFLVEVGVLLDLLVGIFVMGIVINHIQREFSSLDTEQLVGAEGLTPMIALALILVPLAAAARRRSSCPRTGRAPRRCRRPASLHLALTRSPLLPGDGPSSGVWLAARRRSAASSSARRLRPLLALRCSTRRDTSGCATDRPNRVFCACLLAFLSADDRVLVLSQHLGLMWVAVEGDDARDGAAHLLQPERRARSRRPGST